MHAKQHPGLLFLTVAIILAALIMLGFKTVHGQVETSSTTTSAVAVPPIAPVRAPALMDCSVTSLQGLLHNQGYLGVQPTGYFGPLTKAALIKFQADNGIPATGFFGPITKAKIGCNSNQPSSSSISILSPQGGEVLERNALESIVWKAHMPETFAAGQTPPNQAAYTINLAPVSLCLANRPCPLLMIKPYVIASGLLSYDNYQFNYPWHVGSTTETDRTIPDGRYYIQVCETGGQCVQSNSFTISSATSVPVAAGVPAIRPLDPSTGPVGTKVTLFGSNLTSDTSINFGNSYIPAGLVKLMSYTGNTGGAPDAIWLEFEVPRMITPACYFSQPACYISSINTPPGTYNVSVTNSQGTSNLQTFIVTQATTTTAGY